MDTGSAAVVPVIPTEDVVQALMDYLVAPTLPFKSFSTRYRHPSPSLQQSVVKQMHAVVLLYNYYHRKQFPNLEFLDFESFCKVAVISKSSLLTYLEFMRKHGTESKDQPEPEQLSLTEKAIIEACNICSGLDASRDVPNMREWQISKVAVFLIDYTKKNCLLLFSPTTQGVWSPIEKKLDQCISMSEATLERMNLNSKKRTTEELLGDEPGPIESGFQKFAFSAVKETSGLEEKDVTILESHFVYSLCKEKTTVRFYLMKCTKSVSPDIFEVSVNDAINSLKGPLVSKISDSSMVSSVVEYFHLLPYGEILSDWFSREMHQNSSDGSSQTSENLDNQTGSTIGGMLYLKENGESCMDSSLEAIIQLSMIPPVCDESENKCRATHNEVLVCHAKKKMKSSSDGHVSIFNSDCQDKSNEAGLIMEPHSDRSTDSQAACGKDICIVGTSGQDEIQNISHSIPLESRPQNFDDIQSVYSAKRDRLLLAASRVVQMKRDELSQQQRHLQDDIARCEKNLQIIQNGGTEDLNLEIEALIETCNDAWSKGTPQAQMGKHPHSGEHLAQDIKRKNLSEAILSLQSASQDLDDICRKNNWILPRYSVFPTNGGFRANVWIQGMDFESSVGGELQDDPCEAREFAAVHMLSKLRDMARQGQ